MTMLRSRGKNCCIDSAILGAKNILRVRVTGAVALLLSQPSDALVDQTHTIDRTLFLKELGVVASP